MAQQSTSSRLSRILTDWEQVREAHRGADQAAQDARLAVVLRYEGAVRRYLLGALRDAQAADDVFQDFWLRFVQGHFWRAEPERGRFRDYLKTTLGHLVADYWRHRARQPQQLDSALDVAAPSAELEEADRGFVASWRRGIFEHVWTALEEAEQQGGPPYFHVLNFLQVQPEATSAEMAARLTEQLRCSPPLTAPGIRKLLQRGRVRFAELMVAEVERLLDGPTRERLEQALVDLDLLPFCRVALERRKEETGNS